MSTLGSFNAVLRKYFSPKILAEVCEKIDHAPSAFDVWVPFYIEPPKEGEEDPALRKKRERLSS
jgi:hypothetical protein